MYTYDPMCFPLKSFLATGLTNILHNDLIMLKYKPFFIFFFQPQKMSAAFFNFNCNGWWRRLDHSYDLKTSKIIINT